MSDEWSFEKNDEYDFQPEMGAFERVGAPGSIYLGQKAQTRMEKAMMDPLLKFRQYVDAICRNLNNWEKVNISEESIEYMLKKAENLKHIEAKNPTGYILGYIASNGGGDITKTKFNHVVKDILPHSEVAIQPEDVIRYARLWKTL